MNNFLCIHTCTNYFIFFFKDDNVNHVQLYFFFFVYLNLKNDNVNHVQLYIFFFCISNNKQVTHVVMVLVKWGHILLWQFIFIQMYTQHFYIQVFNDINEFFIFCLCAVKSWSRACAECRRILPVCDSAPSLTTRTQPQCARSEASSRPGNNVTGRDPQPREVQLGPYPQLGLGCWSFRQLQCFVV